MDPYLASGVYAFNISKRPGGGVGPGR